MALLVPLSLVYLFSEHPQLGGATVWGWGSGEILWLHAVLVIAIGILGALFSRSRPTLVALSALLFSLAVPRSGLDPASLSLSVLAGGLIFLAAPDRRFFRFSTLTWLGLALIGALGTATILEQSVHEWVLPAVGLALALWGSVLLFLRVRQERGKAISEPLLLSTLVGLTCLGLSLGQNAKTFGEPGFHLMVLLFTLPCLATLVAHSFRLAYIDELTEIPGRRALVEALDDPGSTFTLAMLDVDHFKKFNDTHGHEVGDQVLRMVAARIATVGEGGAAYRYGGEEFTLLFPGKSTEQVLQELERIRALVESSPLYLRSENRPKVKPRAGAGKKTKSSKKKAPSVGVTVSIGVATRNSSESWDRVMKRADQALYKAKEGGRNQVSQAS